jgi:hypothetical protein
VAAERDVGDAALALGLVARVDQHPGGDDLLRPGRPRAAPGVLGDAVANPAAPTSSCVDATGGTARGRRCMVNGGNVRPRLAAGAAASGRGPGGRRP